MKNFALLGAAGYIAPRHMYAIRDTGNRLSIAYDPNDSVGLLDSISPAAEFHTEFEIFLNSVELKKSIPGESIDYFSICSPNYLHYSHAAAGLRAGCDIICEKPLVTHVAMLDELEKVEQSTGHRVYSILQLRLHDAIRDLKKRIDSMNSDERHDVVLTYITSRGSWYHNSWKGDPRRSLGLVTNIGIHFFDMLQFVFGNLSESRVYLQQESKASGYLEYKKARVRWYLSIDSGDLPLEVVGKKTTFRNISIDGEPLEFSDGFTELHRASYVDVLEGNGFGLGEARASIEAVESIRTSSVCSLSDLAHPYVRGVR